MKIDKISCSTPQYRAKFLYTEDLYRVAKYVAEDKEHPQRLANLLKAKNEIGKTCMTTRIKMELFTTPEAKPKPFIIFTRYVPKRDVKVAINSDDYVEAEPVIIQSQKSMNPLKFGYETIVKLSHGIPQNKMFREVVMGITKQ